MFRKLRLTASVSWAGIVIRFAVRDKAVGPHKQFGRGRPPLGKWPCQSRYRTQPGEIWTRPKPPLLQPSGDMFIDVSVQEKRTQTHRELSQQRTDEQTSRWIRLFRQFTSCFISRCVNSTVNLRSEILSNVTLMGSCFLSTCFYRGGRKKEKKTPSDVSRLWIIHVFWTVSALNYRRWHLVIKTSLSWLPAVHQSWHSTPWSLFHVWMKKASE